MAITGLYAGLLALVFLFLGSRISGTRMKLSTSIGDGDHPELAEQVRRHGNFAESVPLALLLLGIVELNGAGPQLVHGLGIALLLARLAHPLGVRHDVMPHPLRALGAGLTFAVTGVAAGTALWQYASLG